MTRSLLPSLPQGWLSVPAKHAVSLNPEVLPENTPEETALSYVDIAALEGGDAVASLSPKELTFGAAPSRARRVLRAGDTILSTVRTYLKAVANFPEAPDGLVASTGFAVLRPIGRLHPRYAYWAALSEPFIENVVAHSEGVSYPAINPSVLGSLHMPMPPRLDQERIANFLDEQTARIDALIAEKERLERVLKESIWDEVTRAVTLGLSRTGMRQTGIDWCPEVPSHWDVLLLRRLFQQTEYGISDSLGPEGPIAVLRMGNLRDGRVEMTDLKYVDEAPTELLLRSGDVLYNRTNSLAQVGKVGVVRELPNCPVTFASYLVRLVPNDRVIPDYLAYLLNCPDVLAIARSLALPAIGQANLNPNRYGYMRVPCPPVEEQRAIVEHLDSRSKAIQGLVDHVAKHIDHLREYRSSLISAAVTGQLQL